MDKLNLSDEEEEDEDIPKPVKKEKKKKKKKANSDSEDDAPAVSKVVFIRFFFEQEFFLSQILVKKNKFKKISYVFQFFFFAEFEPRNFLIFIFLHTFKYAFTIEHAKISREYILMI